MDDPKFTSMSKMEKAVDLGDNSPWSHALGVSKLHSLAAAAAAAGMESSCGTNEKSDKIGDRDARGDKDCSFKINSMSCSVSDKKVEYLKLRSNKDNSDCDLALKMEDTLEGATDSDAPMLSTVRGLKSNFGRKIREEDKADSLPTGSGSEMKDEPFEGIATVNGLNEEAGNLKKKPIDSMICTSLSSEKCLDNVGSSRSNPGKLTVIRTSIYHGVTRHRWSGKYEAHLWDNSCRMEGRRRKGKQVYLGSYDSEEKAARAYDIAALKYWGVSAKLNFPVSEYDIELEDIKSLNRDECVTYLRRRSSCFSRGASVYRGVTRRQRDGRWQARIGRVSENKDIYLGTFKTEEEAAEAYDIAAIELRGLNTVTNFHISNYCEKGLALFEEEDMK